MHSFHRMPDQQDPPTSPSAQPVMSSTLMMVDGILSATNPCTNESQGKPCGELFFCFLFFQRELKSYKITTELDKKPKHVVLKTLKIVLHEGTQIFYTFIWNIFGNQCNFNRFY